jgi:glycolate oxidase
MPRNDVKCLDQAAFEEFESAIDDPARVITDHAELDARGTDFWGFGSAPGLLLRPRSRDEVVAIVEIAHKRGIALVTRGGASNCAGAVNADPSVVMIDMSAMDQILEIDPKGHTARVQPGVVNAHLQERLAPYGLVFSPDPVSRHLATIGGNIIENAGGPHALKYGVTYNHVVSAECVLSDGRVVEFRATDDGPDMLGVVIGSEGTIAILTEATVQLRPIPAVTRSLMGSFATAHAAADTVAAIIQTGTVPACVEWLDHTGIVRLQQYTDTGYPLDAAAIVLIDIDGNAEEVDRETAIVENVLRQNAVEVRRADDEESRAKLWYGRLHALDTVVASGKGFFIGDVTVPREHFPQMQDAIQDAAARHADDLLFIMTCGHAGDGDLHPFTFYERDNPKAPAALLAANNEIVDAALELGGTITGEHGVGTEKRQFMTKRFTPVEIAAQRAIKRVFDPHSMLNPGVMLPDESADEPEVGAFEAALCSALGRYRVDLGEHVSVRRDEQGLVELPDGWFGNDKRISINTANLSLVVGSKVTLCDLTQSLTDHGVTCEAIPSIASNRTVGELIADAVGDERDAVRHALLGIDVLLAGNNAPARFGGESMKDVAGYDTKRLFIAGRNAFGAIVTATFKIRIEQIAESGVRRRRARPAG